MLVVSRQAKMRRWAALAAFLLVLFALYVLGPGLARGRGDGSQRRIGKVAYVTVLTSDEYVLPAQVMADSLKRVTQYPIIVMVTPDVSLEARAALPLFFNEVRDVAPIENPSPPADLLRPSFATVYTKLRVWELDDYDMVTFLDADIVVRHPIDDLFATLAASDQALAAVEDCCGVFNSGVMVLRPSQAVFSDMMKQIHSIVAYDGGDQGFLIKYFEGSWLRLPFIYNALQTVYLDGNNRKAWDLVAPDIRVLHFIQFKPWVLEDAQAPARHTASPQHRILAPILDEWWQARQLVQNGEERLFLAKLYVRP
jgi:hypothetical protein